MGYARGTLARGTLAWVSLQRFHAVSDIAC